MTADSVVSSEVAVYCSGGQTDQDAGRGASGGEDSCPGRENHGLRARRAAFLQTQDLTLPFPLCPMLPV